MDDCNLEKLAIKPGKLSPVFHRDTTEYHSTVSSEVDNIFIDPLTSDSGASYSILGSGGEKKIPLKEGAVTDIIIEVTAEDGTAKKYNIHVRRLSAKDANLSDSKLSNGTLSPEFSPDILSYTCLLPCDVCNITLTPTVPDSKNEVVINGGKPDQSLPLNIGKTTLEIKVTSVDKSNTQVYEVIVTKKQLPRYVKLTDQKISADFECPISLAPLYCPITVKDSDPKHTYSAPFIDEITKTSKIDPLSDLPLSGEWRIEDDEVEKKLSVVTSVIPLTYGGSTETGKFCDLGAQINQCNVSPKAEDVKDKFKNTPATLEHNIEKRTWEKNLQQVFDETDVNQLEKNAENELKTYFASLPKPGQSRNFEDGESPLDYLQNAIHNCASAVKLKQKDHKLHFRLAMLLEERYYAEDLFGLKKPDSGGNFMSFNVQAKESSKSDECDAICKSRGVDASSAPVALQLKAIDEEYHHLLDNGQSARADYVQTLYAWKSKQIMQEGAAAQKASDAMSPLGQAYLKYMDALSLDECKSHYNFHVGRLLVIQGNYSDAVKRFEVALNWNPKHELSRFYLGIALALQKGGPGDREKETISYLLEALEVLLTENSKAAITDEDPRTVKHVLHADNLLRVSNVHLLRCVVQLGKLLAKNKDIKEAMHPNDVFHTAALLASQCLPLIARGDTYQQLEWILLEAHACLLDTLTNIQSPNEHLIAQRCHRLSALIHHSTIPQGMELLDLQEQTCQKYVQIEPCNSHALFLLGTAQLTKVENLPPGEETDKLLQDAKASFQASISLEGKQAAGAPQELLLGQQWWQAKVKKEEAKKAEEAKKSTGSNTTSKGTAPARGGSTAGRGTGAARGGAAARGRGTQPAARGGPAPRGGAAARGGTSRGGVAAASKGKTPVAKSSSTTVSTKQPAVVSSQPPAATTTTDKQEESKSKPSGPVKMNKKTYNPRLGLARVMKASNEIEEAKKYYNEVIALASEVHDAYIESAEMLVKTDPLSAVDIYCKFPSPENPTFDDAYIFGEVIRILMKHEKYDDPRLGPNMISYGRALGIGALEKNLAKLDELFKADLLKQVYAGVNFKTVDDPDLQAFFKFKSWL